MTENTVLSFPSEVVAFGRALADDGPPAAWCHVLRGDEYRDLCAVYQRLRQKQLKPDDRRRTAAIARLVLGRLNRAFLWMSEYSEEKIFSDYVSYRSHFRLVMDFLDAVVDAHREQFGAK
jgi:hypothetical protein